MRDDKPIDPSLGARNSQIAERGKSMIHFPRFAFATKRLAAIVAALTVGFACFAFAGSATTAIIGAVAPQPASASTPAYPWGKVLVPGADWAPGYASRGDLNVYSNGYGFGIKGPTNAFGWEYQCTELAERVANVLWGEPGQDKWSAAGWNGNAYDMWRVGPKLPVPLLQHPNGGADQPQFGDLLIFDRVNSLGHPTEVTGHVAVVKGVVGAPGGTQHVDVVEENFQPLSGEDSSSLVINGTTMPDARGYFGDRILGWLRGPSGNSVQGPDLRGVDMNNTGSGNTEVHILSAASGYTQFSAHIKTALAATYPQNWQFAFAPDNQDLVGIDMNNTGSGNTEVHILSAASGYTQFSAHIKTALAATYPQNWQFAVAPNRDLVGIDMNSTGSGNTEVHILSAASGYTQFSAHIKTALAATYPAQWSFKAGT
jgi:CHAP domain